MSWTHSTILLVEYYSLTEQNNFRSHEVSWIKQFDLIFQVGSLLPGHTVLSIIYTSVFRTKPAVPVHPPPLTTNPRNCRLMSTRRIRYLYCMCKKSWPFVGLKVLYERGFLSVTNLLTNSLKFFCFQFVIHSGSQSRVQPSLYFGLYLRNIFIS